jgi:hypothetical protein
LTGRKVVYAFEVFVGGVDGSFSHVSIALVRALIVVVVEPFIQVLLEGLHGVVELGAKGGSEKLVQGSSVEALHEAVGAGRARCR